MSDDLGSSESPEHTFEVASQSDSAPAEATQVGIQQPLPIPGMAQFRMEGRVHQGPLPSPDDLRDYALLVPDLPGRWMNLFELQTHHRIDLERNTLRVNEEINHKVHDGQATRDAMEFQTIRRAQLIGGGLLTLILMSVVWLATRGQEWFAGVMIGVTVTVAWLFRSAVVKGASGKEKAEIPSPE